MQASPGEGVVEVELPQHWNEDEARATAVLRAAAHLVCGCLIPLPSTPGIPQFAVALESGIPGILELDAVLPLGSASVRIRASTDARPTARRVAEEIRDRAAELAPDTSRRSDTSSPEPLPF